MKFFFNLSVTILLLGSNLFGEDLVKKYRLYLGNGPQNKVGTVTRTTGSGESVKIGRTSIDQLRKGDLIHNGDIVTQISGQTNIKFVGGASVTMNADSKLVVNKSGIGTLYGNLSYNTGKRNLEIDTKFANLNAANSTLDVISEDRSILNAYTASEDSVKAIKGSINIKTPPDVEEFTIKYQNTGQVVVASNFVLKKDEKAIFDGEHVTIINTKRKIQPQRNRKGIRNYIGFAGGTSFLQRTMETSTSNTNETKLVGKVGFSYVMMDGRLDPMIFLTYTTDPELDEIRLEYLVPKVESYGEYWFKTTPYVKYIAGIGNTYSNDLVPTHTSLGAGVGLFKKLGSEFFFIDLNYKKREWKFDRFGDTEKWSENEVAIDFNYIYRLRLDW